MRILVFLAGMLLISGVIADDESKPLAKRIDKSTPVLMTEPPSDEPEASKAQDYNSSRSNTTSRVDETRAQDYNSSRSNNINALDTDDDGDTVPTEDACRDAVDNDCSGPSDDKSVERSKQ